MAYEYLTSTGVIVADTSTTLGEVQATWQAAFGSDLIVTADTPQGVIITTQTLAQSSMLNNNAALANQINPNIAGGVFLDAIMALTFPRGRTPATKTTVVGVVLTGVASTVIPAGSQARTAAGDLFATQTLVTLDVSGSATVDFASVEYGAIPCAINALDTIVTNVLGWETVDNNNAGVLGTTTQSDQAARALRSNTLGFQGVSLAVAITSSLYATDGVISLSYLENYNSAPMGMIIYVTGGPTLDDTTWSMVTTGDIVVGSTGMEFIESLQDVPSVNPWPVAAYTTTGNITLSGLATQANGDWPSTLTSGDIILAKNQSAASANGLWVAASGAWSRQSYNTGTILGSNSGISMIKNSIYTCVDGGSDLDIAASLLENKSGGCAWNGNASVQVVEPASGQIYDVKFDRPESISVLIKVYTTNGNTNNIIQAVLNYAAGLINGLTGFVVGNDVSPFEISGAIMSQYPSYFISKVELSLSSPISYSTSTLPIAINEIAYTQSSYITVVV
jgi:hypothetical protein